MTFAEQPAQPATAPHGSGVATGLEVKVFESLAAAETPWRDLEARGIVTPYQRFDWISGLHAAGADAGIDIAVATIGRNGRTVALLPLGIKRGRLLTTARLLGTEQSNADWMISEPGFAPGQTALRGIFEQISQAVGGIDLVSLQNQPASWSGTPNPLLALPHAPAASNLYVTTIAGITPPFVESRVPAKKRGNLRRGRRRLEEAMGPVRLVRVTDQATLERVHAVFLEQRKARFDAMGIDNIFGTPLFVRFFKQAVSDGFAAAHPIMCAHALMAGDEIVATTWGAMTKTHYSLFINSAASGPTIKFSLMGILIGDLMDELLARGIETFDLGLGDFDYKADWTEPATVYNGTMALTAKGRLAASARSGQTTIKRAIKQNPTLWTAASRVRQLLFRLRPGR